MDSDSDGNRQEIQVCKSDNMESVMEAMEEDIPKILSPELHEVFHLFANMLDLKSFMRLALTSKDTHKRCLEDKEIKINVNVDKLDVMQGNGSVVLSWPLEDNYASALRKLPCSINVDSLEIHDIIEVSELIGRLKESGVHRIQKLGIHEKCRDWDAVIAIVQVFDVKSMYIWTSVSKEILHSLLQLNLEKLWYNGRVSIDFLLEIDSPIREIVFPEIRRIPNEKLMLIASKIQSSSLSHLTVDRDAINWEGFDLFSFDWQGPLPEDRPLILTRRPERRSFDRRMSWEHWILHSNGEVTKCAMYDLSQVQLFKCEPWEYPWILRKEEDILKSLSEKRPAVLCTHNHFRTFSDGLTMLDPSHEGPLPKDRPLYCKVSEYEFWLLQEDENLMNCAWENDVAMWQSCKSFYSKEKKIEHPALAKHMFWHFLKQLKRGDFFDFCCNGRSEFVSWFNDFQKLDFEYSDALPNTRPLVFEKSERDEMPARFEVSNPEPIFYRLLMAKSLKPAHLCVVLLEDRLMECIFYGDCLKVSHCSNKNRPPILFSAENVLEMLKDPNCDKERSYVLSFEMFREGFKLFTGGSPAAIRKPLPIWERVTAKGSDLNEEYWYELDEIIRKVVWKEGRVRFEKKICDDVVRKIEWKRGRLSNDEADLRESPPNFMKEVFKYFAGHVPQSSFLLELEQFRSCLEQFTVLPFDYSGPLNTDSPLVFMKNEIRHTCRKGAARRALCDCTDFSILVWFLWKGMRVTHCSWEGHESKKVLFGQSVDDDVPSAFKSNEYLKSILQAEYDKSSRFDWFGRFKDFLACFNEYVKLPARYNGPLTEERPLFFNSRPSEEVPVYFILREDGTIIQCKKKSATHFSMSLPLDKDCVPPAVKSLL